MTTSPAVDPAAPPLDELLPPLTPTEAHREATRCLYCYDAPCLHACPTHIDIPTFIRKIATGNVRGSATTILEENFLGGTCARVCPVEELCQGACVLGADSRPIQIGRLQRYAVDHLQARGIRPFTPAATTGKRILVVGSGPAGLSAAAELAKLGHDVTLWERRELAGGLSSYGIVTLREPLEIAQREVEMVRDLGVTVLTGRELSSAPELRQATAEFDAVFLGIGLGPGVTLDVPGSEHAVDGLDYIERGKLRPESLPQSRHTVVVGAGNTAIDAATIAKRAGAEVTMVYRRTAAEMTAYQQEYEFALTEGIVVRFLVQPTEILAGEDGVVALRCARVRLGEPDASGRPRPVVDESDVLSIDCDQVVIAIGQSAPPKAAELGLEVRGGYVAVDGQLRTNLPGVYAGGDAIRIVGAASTVKAVQDGKLAAAAIHADVMAETGQE